MDKWIKLLVLLTTIFIILELIIVNITSGVGSGAALISDSVATFILISFFSSGISQFHARS